MKSAFVSILWASVFLTGPVLAHSGGEHVMGTVKSVEPSSLSVATKDGKTVDVHIDDKTEFEKSGSKSSLKELVVGERVVVHAMRHGDMLHATLVKYGKQAKGDAGVHESHQGHGSHGEHGSHGHEAKTAPDAGATEVKAQPKPKK